MLLPNKGTQASNQLIAYDCSDWAGQNVKVYEYDLTANQQSCRNRDSNFKTRNRSVMANVLQRKEYRTIDVIKCNLKIGISVAYCGSNGYDSRVYSEQVVVVDEPVYLTRVDCLRAKDKGLIQFPNHYDKYGTESGNEIQIPISSGKEKRFIYVVGSYHQQKATCDYGEFRLRGKSYNRHWQKISYSIEISKTSATLLVDDRVLVFDDGIKTSQYDQGYTIDSVKSESVYVYDLFHQKMYDDMFHLVNQAPAVIHESMQEEDSNIMIMDKKASKTAIIILPRESICIAGRCYEAFDTYIPNIFIILVGNQNNAPKLEQSPVKDISLYAQVKSEFQSAMIMAKMEIDTSFKNVAETFCEMQRNLIKTSPQLALQMMHEKNIKNMVRAGSVLYFQACKERIVSVNMNNTCYKDLPIQFYNNDTNQYVTAFLDSLSNKIISQSEISSCSMLLPNKYHVIDATHISKWICYTPTRLPDDSCSPPGASSGTFNFFKLNVRNIDTSLYPPNEVQKLVQRSHEDSVDVGPFSPSNALTYGTVSFSRSDSQVGENTVYNMLTGKDIPIPYVNYLEELIETILNKMRHVILIAYILNVVNGLHNAYTGAKRANIFITLLNVIKALACIPINPEHSNGDFPPPPPFPPPIQTTVIQSPLLADAAD